VHSNLGAEGAVRALESITTGLGWSAVAPVLVVEGGVDKADRESLYELGGTLAATLMG
jgi:hypothetical protein